MPGRLFTLFLYRDLITLIHEGPVGNTLSARGGAGGGGRGRIIAFTLKKVLDSILLKYPSENLHQ